LLLWNDGASPLTIQNLTLQGAEFSLVEPSGAFQPRIVEPGANNAFHVKIGFSPAAEGHFLGSLTIEHDDPSQADRVVVLSGTSGARVRVMPEHLLCEDVPVGKETLCGMVQVSNVGSAPLVVAD